MGQLIDEKNREFLLQQKLNQIVFGIKNKNLSNQKEKHIEYFTKFGCQYFSCNVLNQVDFITSILTNSSFDNTIFVINDNKAKIDSYSRKSFDDLINNHLIGYPITINLVVAAFKEKYKHVFSELQFPSINIEHSFPDTFYKIKLGMNTITFKNEKLINPDLLTLYDLFLNN